MVKPGRRTWLWRSGLVAVSALAKWLYVRLGLTAFTYHVPTYANSFPYLLGGITLFGIIVVGVSGIYLGQFYHPDPTEAHASVVFISKQVRLGDFVRGVHLWSSHLVLVTLLLHLIRVFVSRAFRPPREMLWLVGSGLLVLMMALFFTGTVLKWDQEGFEALEHNEAAGRLVGSLGIWFTSEFSRTIPLLTRVYVAHVGILPMLLVILIAGHLLLIRIHGIAAPVGREAETEVEIQAATRGEATPAVSHFNEHVVRVTGFGLVLTAFAGLLALVLSAPLGPEATPGMEVTKPPWVFLWLYPFENWWGLKALLWIPIALLVALIALPFVGYLALGRTKRWVFMLAVFWATLLTLVALGIYGWLTTPAAHLMG